MVDTRRKKIIAVQAHVLPRGDTRDVKALLQRARPRIIVADKGYDSEAIHERCHDLGIQSMIPARKTTKKGHYRKIALKAFRTRTYHRRELAKALISAIKRTLGGSIRCRRARTIRAEIIRKCIVYNAFLMLYRLLGQILEFRLCPESRLTMPAAGFGGVPTSDGLTSPKGASPCQCATCNTSAFAIAAGWTLRTEP